jgi:hypothetical protein
MSDVAAAAGVETAGVETAGGETAGAETAGAKTAGAETAGAATTGSGATSSVRLILPAHLRGMAKVDGEVRLEVDGNVTQRAVLDALEARFPMLRGTIRDRATARRRAFVRFYACGQDRSHDDPDDPLPPQIASGEEPLMVVGAMAGG